jgi:hypothetical protein
MDICPECPLRDPTFFVDRSRYRCPCEQRADADAARAAVSTPEPARVPEASRFAAFQAAMMLVYECDYRGPRADCGCTRTHVCYRGASGHPTKPREASVSDCLDCTRRPEPIEDWTR